MTNLQPQNFANLFKNSRFAYPKLEGNIIEGTVLGIKKNIVIVDVGLKMNVKFLLSELNSIYNNNLKVGDRLQFFLNKIETSDGDILLNFEKAQNLIKEYETWKVIEDAYEKKKYISGRILNYINGGFSVGLGGIVAFLPVHKNKIVKMISTKFFIKSFKTFYILKINRAKNNIIVSRTSLLNKTQNFKSLNNNKY